MATDDPLTIVSLEVQNVQRVRSIRIRTKGPTVILGGRNEQGKTSVLDAIEMALGGARAFSERPIRDGARQASVVVDLGELVVERVIGKNGTTLTVRGRDGARMNRPQQILDELFSRISFDPLAFSRLPGDKQNEILRQIAGLDFTGEDRQRQAFYDIRTRTARDAKTARGASERIEVPPGTPAEPIRVEDLLAELDKAHELARAVSSHATKVEAARQTLERAETALRRAEAERDAARVRLAQLEREAPPAPPDVAQLSERVRAAQGHNQHIARRKERAALEADANALDAQVAELSIEIEKLDAAKAAAIAAAAFPIPGLALGETGPTLNGVPLSQSSGAQKLKVSVAIGFALNPRLRVLLVRDASLLDDDSLALVAQLAAQQGGQVWLEKVSRDGEGCTVLIEDGEARDVEAHVRAG